MKKLTVETKNKAYDIIIKNGLLEEIEKYLPHDKRIFLITNNKLADIYSDFVSNFKDRVIIKDGEENKNFETYKCITEEILSKKIERKDLILAFGGGVTGDLAGFAAATILRGVNFIQLPTTLLAQVDSSIGGKTGFNTKYGKNLLGAFYQPDKVLIDPLLLKTLDEKEIKTGLGEIIKYGFIEKNCTQNKEFYLYDCLLGEIKDYFEVIYKSAALKSFVASKDEKEKGLRAVLNFGHTFAHAIETVTNYKKFTHGQAVAMGMKSAFELARNLGIITDEYYFEGHFLIDKYNLAPVYKIAADKEEFIKIMKSDKKVLNSKIRLVLPVSKGRVKIFDNINEDEIKNVI